MSDAEMFLIAWAVIATVVAGVYASKAKTQEIQKQILMGTIHDIAKGEAQASIVGNRVTVKQVEKNDGDTSK